jgi:hypothetical protein
MKKHSNKEKDPIAVELGSRGGKKIFKLRGVSYMKELSEKAAKARQEKRQLQNQPE